MKCDRMLRYSAQSMTQRHSHSIFAQNNIMHVGLNAHSEGSYIKGNEGSLNTHANALKDGPLVVQ